MTRRKKLAIVAGAAVAGVLVVLVAGGGVAPLTGVLIAIGVGGAVLWAPKYNDVSARADVGSALVTTAAISAVFFGLTTQDEHKQAAIAQQDQTKQEQIAENEALLLALRTKTNLTGIDLTNQPLGKFDLGHKRLVRANLYGLDLSQGFLTGSDLDGASLNRAYLVGTHIQKASLIGAKLEGVVLTGASFNGSFLQGATFGISYQAGKPPRRSGLGHASFEDADLAGACLAGATLTNANFEGADVRNANFDFANLAHATFSRDGVGADIHGATFYGAILDVAGRRYLRSHSADLAAAAKPAVVRPPKNAPFSVVIKHSDGDTLELRKLGWVRLLGVNAPDNTGPATEWATRYIAHALPVGAKAFYLIGHPGQEPRPEGLGRKLAYLWTARGQFVNEELLLKGLGLRETDQLQRHMPYRKALTKAEGYARAAGKGLWAYCPDYQANDLIIAK